MLTEIKRVLKLEDKPSQESSEPKKDNNKAKRSNTAPDSQINRPPEDNGNIESLEKPGSKPEADATPQKDAKEAAASTAKKSEESTADKPEEGETPQANSKNESPSETKTDG